MGEGGSSRVSAHVPGKDHSATNGKECYACTISRVIGGILTWPLATFTSEATICGRGYDVMRRGMSLRASESVGTSRVGALPSRGTKLPLTRKRKSQGEGRIPLTRQPMKPLVVLEAVLDVVDLAPRCRFCRGHTLPTTCRGSSSLAPATLVLHPGPPPGRTNIPFFPKGHFLATFARKRSVMMTPCMTVL